MQLSLSNLQGSSSYICHTWNAFYQTSRLRVAPYSSPPKEGQEVNCTHAVSKVWIPHPLPMFKQDYRSTHELQPVPETGPERAFIFVPHANPPALVSASLGAYSEHSIEKAYNASGFYWNLAPRIGDRILFNFTSPTRLFSVSLRSGSNDYPDACFQAATVEVKVARRKGAAAFPRTEDGWSVLCGMEPRCRVFLPIRFGLVHQMRIRFHRNSSKSVILSQIVIEEWNLKNIATAMKNSILRFLKNT
ncbi:alpha-1,3-mannosyl-glycoprotein 4-beta-N-acetylglucosaminyltransferase B-like [Ornithodoros turicata]|uniref:alpha-1,3-mannosyl-glycoprotein 4-beta-N-acetylglucosaminyltransferase B-like n=1 Tax=Ornithodoros turicata TaxID=34597 RepID=UPI003138D8CD